MVKLKEEFDYKSLCRRLETELDRLVAENERQVKARQDEEEENERKLEDTRECAAEAESKLAAAMEVVQYDFLVTLVVLFELKDSDLFIWYLIALIVTILTVAVSIDLA